MHIYITKFFKCVMIDSFTKSCVVTLDFIYCCQLLHVPVVYDMIVFTPVGEAPLYTLYFEGYV